TLGPAPHAHAHTRRVPGVLRPRPRRNPLDCRNQKLPRATGPGPRCTPRRPRTPGRPLPESRRLRHQVQARRLAKMALFGDIAGDDADAVATATSQVVRLA